MLTITLLAPMALLFTFATAKPINPPGITPRNADITMTFCIDANYGNCQNIAVPNNNCYDLGPALNNKISSVKFPPNVGCTWFDATGCSKTDGDYLWRVGDEQYLTAYGSEIDGKFHTYGANAWNDRISSVQCTTVS